MSGQDRGREGEAEHERIPYPAGYENKIRLMDGQEISWMRASLTADGPCGH
jgi:hypothetical protein